MNYKNFKIALNSVSEKCKNMEEGDTKMLLEQLIDFTELTINQRMRINQLEERIKQLEENTSLANSD